MKLLKHPFVIVLPVVGVIIVGWFYYLYISSVGASSSSDANLISYGDFEKTSQTGVPPGWTINHYGSSRYSTARAPGRLMGNAMSLTVGSYADGNVDIVTPLITVDRRSARYLYKGYYISNMPLDLLVRYYYTNGTARTIHVHEYPQTYGEWTTVAVSLRSDNTIDGIRVLYRIAGNGSLRIDDVYAEHNEGITVPEVRRGTLNVVRNAVLQGISEGIPDQWYVYDSGEHEGAVTVDSDTNGSLLRARLSSYKNGELKWEPAACDVTPGQRYYFEVEYSSTVKVPLIAEYQISDGTRKYVTLEDLAPTGKWTTYSTYTEVPADAVKLSVSLPLQRVGMVESRSYILENVTHYDRAQLQHPMVSITLDDGLRSAYTGALPIFDRYGLKGTFYVNPITPTDADYLTIDQMRTLANDRHEIGSHAYQHFDMVTLSRDLLDYQLRLPVEFFAEHVGIRVPSLAVPYGREDPEVQWYARKYYTSLRGTRTGINTIQNYDPYNLLTVYIDKNTSVWQLKQALQEARSANGWLILVYHGVGDRASTTTTLDARSFDIQMKLVKESNIPVVTVRDGIRAMTALDR